MESYSSIPIEELLHRCAVEGDGDAWNDFVRRFQRIIATVVIRKAAQWGDASRQTADDLVQETYMKLCANNYRMLRQFEHRGPEAFAAWVRVIAANVVHDHFKASYSQKRGSNKIDGFDQDSTLAASESSAGGIGFIERAVLIQDVQRHLDVCVAGPESDRNNQIFWLYYRTGLSAAAIARLPGIGLTTKGVESLSLRITRELRARMAQGRPSAGSTAEGPCKGILPAESF
jgi:RNA polymerase sigma-70 factor (ECF subfamily)